MREEPNRTFWHAVKQDAKRAATEYPSLLETKDGDWNVIAIRSRNDDPN